MKIKFLVMCSPIKERQDNVEIMKKGIPDLVVKNCSRENLFDKFVDCFNLEEEYDGLVLMEDDIQLCKNFYSKINEIIEQNRDITISFFEKACSKKELHTSILNGNEFAWTQCDYFPKDICKILSDKNNVADFKENYFKMYKVWNYPADTYINFILNKYKMKYLMKLPFLVQHLDFKSAVGGRSTKRQTRYFIDDLGGEDYDN